MPLERNKSGRLASPRGLPISVPNDPAVEASQVTPLNSLGGHFPTAFTAYCQRECDGHITAPDGTTKSSASLERCASGAIHTRRDACQLAVEWLRYCTVSY